MTSTVKILAEKYGFDADEAERYLKDNKRKTKSSQKAKIPLPFCGKIQELWCNGIRLNHGLYSQCTNAKVNGGYCKTCARQAERNGGKPTYGTVEDRMAQKNPLDYKDPKGKRVVPYANVMEKLGISRKEAEEAAKELGWTIREEDFAKRVMKKGRPAKKKEAEEVKEKKPRGRPRKTKKVVTDEVDNLVESLVDRAKQQTKQKTPPPCKKVTESNVVEELESESESESEEKEVSKVTYDGKDYLEDNDGKLYDIETHNEVGRWDDVKKSVVKIA